MGDAAHHFVDGAGLCRGTSDRQDGWEPEVATNVHGACEFLAFEGARQPNAANIARCESEHQTLQLIAQGQRSCGAFLRRSADEGVGAADDAEGAEFFICRIQPVQLHALAERIVHRLQQRVEIGAVFGAERSTVIRAHAFAAADDICDLRLLHDCHLVLISW